MQWRLHELGFLPLQDPATTLSEPVFRNVERLGKDLPRLLHERRFREALVEYLTPTLDADTLSSLVDEREIERLFLLFSYFASAYIHSPFLPAVHRIPAVVAIPLTRLARQVERPPILSYCSYCLHNWRRIEATGPVALGNLQLLQNFGVAGDAKEDEDWFILVHVDIEARAGPALQALAEAEAAMTRHDSAALETLLETTAASLLQMNRTLARMPEGCRPEVYYQKVRPYIFGFTDVVYEGCFHDAPRTWRGETGAQSSIVPTLLAALGIRHQSSLLMAHLDDMRNYMPPPQRAFIHRQTSVRAYVSRAAAMDTTAGRQLKDRYNECVSQLLAFRTRHFDYAVNYIEKKVANPIATGGTPYIPWLRQLIEETKEHFLP